MFKKFLKLVSCIFIGLGGLVYGTEELKVIKIGVTAGPPVEVMEFVKERALEAGLDVKIIEFNDYILPNAALAQGDLDLNAYQHQPFLDEQIRARGYKLVSIGKTIIFPMGLYSKKIKDLKDFRNGVQIAIPNDPTNGGRALLLLEKAGLITLKKDADHTASILDIKENPKKLKIIEIEAPQLPQALKDVDAAIINTDWALLAGLTPGKDTLIVESKDSPYANLIVAREKDKENKDYKKLVELYQSDATARFIEDRFKGAVIPAWK